jgi:hypothetical protein
MPRHIGGFFSISDAKLYYHDDYIELGVDLEFIEQKSQAEKDKEAKEEAEEFGDDDEDEDEGDEDLDDEDEDEDL